MENTNITRSVAPTLASIRLGDAHLKVGHDGSSVKTCRTLLNNKGYSCNTNSTIYDDSLKSLVAKFQAAFGLKNDGYLGQATLAVLEDTQSDTGWFSNGTVNITAGKLARMGFGKQVLKPANVQKLNAACNSYGINSKTKVRHFLAQGMAETDQGKTFTEYVYRPGDTSKYTQYAPFCGAGFIQLTWSHTYSAFRTYMKSNKNIDDSKITVPAEYATQHVADTYPFESAGWFWHVYKDLNSKIVEWASLSAADTVKNVTAVVKGSSAGYETRLSYYEEIEKAKTIFK